MHPDQNPARIALLYNEHHYHAKVVQLARCLADTNVHIWLEGAGSDLPEELAECDLILVEAFGTVDNERQAMLNQIRAGSRAPVVMLTSGERAERTIEGLLAGADAVISLSTALDVMVAHCRALLRRWQTQHRYMHSMGPDFSHV